jgi:hypothetical protein
MNIVMTLITDMIIEMISCVIPYCKFGFCFELAEIPLTQISKILMVAFKIGAHIPVSIKV